MIQARAVGVHAGSLRFRGAQILRDARQIGQRHARQQCQRDRILARGGNDVARKRLPLPRHDVRGIVDRGLPAKFPARIAAVGTENVCVSDLRTRWPS